MDEKTRNDLLLHAYDNAPQYIQEYIKSGKFSTFMQQLQKRLVLHADVASKVSNEFLMVLLGIISPNELPDNLSTELNLPNEIVEIIIEEADKGIFEPLREQLKESGTNVQTSPKKLEAPKQEWVEVTQKKPTVPPPAPSYTASPPPAPSVSVLHQTQPQGFQMHQTAPSVQVNVTLPGSIPPQPAPIPHVPTAPPVAPTENYGSQRAGMPSPVQNGSYQHEQISYQAPQPEVPQVAAVRTMASDIEAVKSGQAPSAHLVPMHGVSDMNTPQRGQGIPPPMTEYPSSQKSAAPQPPQPIQPPQPQYTRPYIPSSTSRTPAPPPPRLPGSDPYREPFE